MQNFQSLCDLQTEIGTIKWFSSLRHWFHTTTKQNRGKEKEQPPCGWILAPHLRTSKQHFVSFFFFFLMFKNTSLKAQPGNSIVSLRAVFSFMCQNQHGFQAVHSDLMWVNRWWGSPALVFTVSNRAMERYSLLPLQISSSVWIFHTQMFQVKENRSSGCRFSTDDLLY